MTVNYRIIPTPEVQAKVLYGIDQYLREVIQDEEIFDLWLTYGCPDGADEEEIRSYCDLEGETFKEWVKLADKLLKADAK